MPRRWEYNVVESTMAERWSKKAQTQELAELHERINRLGAEGWEMISYESIPLYGAYSSKLKGYTYLLFFKREVEG